MKMFKKFVAIAAALLAVILTSGAAMVSAGASGADTHSDLCVIAVRVDDPSIKAQTGNCPKSATYNVDLTVGVMGWMPPERGLHITVRNQTSGAVLVDTDSRGVEQIKDSGTEAPTYEVWITVDGKSFGRYLTAEDFTKTFEDDDTVTWTLTGNTVFDSIAYKYLDDFSADPAMEYGEPSEDGPALEYTPPQ